MNTFGFRADRKITDVISEGRFTLSAEVIPPRNGAEQAKILGQINSLIEAGAQFLAVTKGAGGSLRGGSLPIAHAIKDQFKVPCIAHFTCRDLSPEDVENQLVDHHYFGIRNILALRGDPPRGQENWQPKDGSYPFAYQLIEQIRALNEGQYLNRKGGPKADTSEKTDFCIGAAVYPEHPDPLERTEYFSRKIEAGAEYAITQMVFDPDAYGRFLDGCAKNGIDVPVLPGTRVLKSRAQGERMASMFGVSVPRDILARLPEDGDPDQLERAADLFMPFAEKLQALGAPGIHLFVLVDTELASVVLRRLGAGQTIPNVTQGSNAHDTAPSVSG